METNNTVDPFRAVQEEVARVWNYIESSVAKWRKLSTKSPKHEPTRKEILASIADLQVDLQDMQNTIDMALKDPTKWALTPSELMTRQTFVRDLMAQANDARELLDPSPLPSGRQGQGRCRVAPDPDSARSGLCAAGSSMDAMSSEGAHRSAVHRENDATLGASQQQQEEIIAVQETELGVLSESLDRLGNMSKAMNEEMKAQGRELDEFTSEVESASDRMTAATATMKKMLKKNDRGKFCAILVLSLVLILLIYAVMAW